MNDVLLRVGTTVSTLDEDGEVQEYLIIGRRCYNPNSGKSWDYVSVPVSTGFEMKNKTEHPYENNNLYFFNHTDIIDDSVVEPKV